jgi:hypothetical protein
MPSSSEWKQSAHGQKSICLSLASDKKLLPTNTAEKSVFSW